MAVPTTSIKVPVSLRDRLAARAREQAVPLAAVIEQALTTAEERDFWTAIAAEHIDGRVPEQDDDGDATLGDDLADDHDDEISRANGW